VVFQHDGKEIHAVVVLTEVHTSGNKVRARCVSHPESVWRITPGHTPGPLL
jgi:hypothetical protein